MVKASESVGMAEIDVETWMKTDGQWEESRRAKRKRKKRSAQAETTRKQIYPASLSTVKTKIVRLRIPAILVRHHVRGHGSSGPY